MAQDTDALIVFAKNPAPGLVKTRLTAKISEDDAAALYGAFLRDSLAQYQLLDVAVRLYIAPPLNGFPRLEAYGISARRPQVGPTLGARMKNAFEETFALGFKRVAIIGTDHPTLPLSIIEKAFNRLAGEEQLVIGPSQDGGYYMLGKSRLMPFLFEDMEYSHRRVLQQTVQRADAAGISPSLLPRWYDVDTPSDLKQLAADVQKAAVLPEHTCEVLRNLNLI